MDTEESHATTQPILEPMASLNGRPNILVCGNAGAEEGRYCFSSVKFAIL